MNRFKKHVNAGVACCLFDMSKIVEKNATTIEENKEESQTLSSSNNRLSDPSKYGELAQIKTGWF